MFPEINSFELKTLIQEKGNIHLYEKMGYVSTGETKKINDSLDILLFRKNISSS